MSLPTPFRQAMGEGELKRRILQNQAMSKPTPVKRPRGRPVLPEDQRHTARVEIRMTEAQRAKLELLGGAEWLRTRIDKARKP